MGWKWLCERKEAQKWVSPSAGCGEEAEVREDDLGFSRGSLSRGLCPLCLSPPASGLVPPQTRQGPGPAGAALPRPLPAESPRELRPLRSSRLRPAPSNESAAFSTVASASGPTAEENAELPPHPLLKPAPGNQGLSSHSAAGLARTERAGLWLSPSSRSVSCRQTTSGAQSPSIPSFPGSLYVLLEPPILRRPAKSSGSLVSPPCIIQGTITKSLLHTEPYVGGKNHILKRTGLLISRTVRYLHICKYIFEMQTDSVIIEPTTQRTVLMRLLRF